MENSLFIHINTGRCLHLRGICSLVFMFMIVATLSFGCTDDSSRSIEFEDEPLSSGPQVPNDGPSDFNGDEPLQDQPHDGVVHEGDLHRDANENQEPDVTDRGLGKTNGPVPLYEPSQKILTRAFVESGPFVVVEFTAECGMNCPEGMTDGDVGLDSWRLTSETHDDVLQKVLVDRIILDNLNHGAFDRWTTRSSNLHFNAGRILRETHSRHYGPAQMTGRGLHWVEFDPLTGTFGAFDNATEVSESIVEPLYVKESELAPAPQFDHLTMWFYLTQPFINGFHHGVDGLGTAHLNPMFENEELVWLRASPRFSNEDARFWSDQGQRMVFFLGAAQMPQPVYAGARADREAPIDSLSQRLISEMGAQYPDAAWRGRLELLHEKRAHLLTAQSPVTGTWRGAPVAVVADIDAQTVSLQRFETDRAPALSNIYDVGLVQAFGEGVFSSSPKSTSEDMIDALDSEHHLTEPILEMVGRLPHEELRSVLAETLAGAGDDLPPGQSVGAFITEAVYFAVLKLLAEFDGGWLEQRETELAAEILAQIFVDVENAADITQRVMSSFDSERLSLSPAQERDRLARRIIRPFSRYSDGPVQTLGEFIDDIVDDPVTQTVGDLMGTIGTAMELAMSVVGLGQFGGACGVLPTDAQELADGMFGVHGAGLERENLVFIEAMKLLEYESVINFSFADRLSHVLEASRRLDQGLAPLVGLAVNRLLGHSGNEQNVDFVSLYAQRLDFEEFAAAFVKKWTRLHLQAEAPELFELYREDVRPDGFDETALDAVQRLPGVEAFLSRTLHELMPAPNVLEAMSSSLLSEVLQATPWLLRDHRLDMSLSNVIYREVLRDHRFADEIGHFINDVLGSFVDGWSLNSRIAQLASDEVRLARGDCIGVWMTTLKRAQTLLGEESAPALVIQQGIASLNMVTHKMRQVFFTAAVGGIIAPLVKRHRKSVLSYVSDIAAEPNEILNLAEVFGESVDSLEAFPSDYGLVLFGQNRTHGLSHAHLAVVDPHTNLIETIELPDGVELSLGAKVVGSRFVFGTRFGGGIVYRSLSLITGEIRPFLSTDGGILTDVQTLNDYKTKVVRIRNEPFDGPLTTQHFGDGVYSNGFERALDGMLYVMAN